MAFVIADRVRETSTTTGTGNFTLAGAVDRFRTFDSVLDTGDTTYYTIADQSGVGWEVGIATFTSPATLARTTILSSSNSGNAVDFGAGSKDVFITLPASKTNVEDQPNLIEVNSTSDALRITQIGTGNALMVEDAANPDSSPFVIDASGNVGIGTTAPGSALDVKGTLRLSGATSGYVGLAPAAAAGSTTYTLPAADGTSGQVLSTNGSSTLSWASTSTLTRATSVTASGTSVDFTGIPSGVKRVTLMFNNVSTTGTNNILIQLIHSGGTVVSSGYRSASARFNGAALLETASTAGFLINSATAADDHYGSYVFTNLTGNIWTGVGSTTYLDGLICSCGGVTIASTLTGIRTTTTGGTFTFDTGSINILYE
jgi:hypothetical protein